MAIMNSMRNIEWRPLRNGSSAIVEKQHEMWQPRPTDKNFLMTFSVNTDFNWRPRSSSAPMDLENWLLISPPRLEDNFVLTKSNHRHAAVIMRKHGGGTRLHELQIGEQKTWHDNLEPQLFDCWLKSLKLKRAVTKLNVETFFLH